jgi:hypothetical protein
MTAATDANAQRDRCGTPRCPAVSIDAFRAFYQLFLPVRARESRNRSRGGNGPVLENGMCEEAIRVVGMSTDRVGDV